MFQMRRVHFVLFVRPFFITVAFLTLIVVGWHMQLREEFPGLIDWIRKA